MRRVTSIVAALTGAALVAVPTALAASPQQTAREFASGKRNISPASVHAALHNPTVQGYAGPGQQGEMQKSAAAGVAAASKPIRAAAPANASGGTLPFTGQDLGLFAALGLALIVGGYFLRRTSRGSDSR
jgi:hypothetical protein